MTVKDKILKYGGFVVLVTLVYALTDARGVLPVWVGVKPLVMIPLIICIAMFEGDVTGAAMGAYAGALMDAGNMGVFGFSAILLMLCGFTAGILITYLMRNNVFTALLLCSGTVFIYGFLYWFFFYAIVRYASAFHVFIRYFIPAMLYTAVCMPIFYFIYLFFIRRLRHAEE